MRRFRLLLMSGLLVVTGCSSNVSPQDECDSAVTNCVEVPANPGIGGWSGSTPSPGDAGSHGSRPGDVVPLEEDTADTWTEEEGIPDAHIDAVDSPEVEGGSPGADTTSPEEEDGESTPNPVADAASPSDGGGADPADTEQGGDEPLPYPEKSGYQIKALQPDFWPDMNFIAEHGTGGIAVNMVWSMWQPEPSTVPCSGDQVEYDGHCYTISNNFDNAVRAYSEMGVHVTAVVYGVPAWARQNVDCSPVTAGFEIFCKPDEPADYGRFAGMLAHRYNGLQGNGRIIDFVIHNEVNANDWFDIGCGQGVPCNEQVWVETYAENYIAAFDAIVLEQPHAKVLMSFDHHYGEEFQQPGSTNPKLSVKWFLTQIAPMLGDREWRVAYHPYPPSLLHAEFSPLDLPRVTYGNIGILLGFLHAQFPNDPHAWDVQLTESGVNSVAPHSTPEAQAAGVCDSLYNVLGTPGISNYVYHRMKDHPVETASGLGCGLADENGNLKPAWNTWAMSNRIDLNPPQLSCGFENLPYTRLARVYKAGVGHWATTRKPPADYMEEQVYRLFRDEQPGTSLLFECMKASGDSLVSKEASCGGHQPMGPLGWIHDEEFPGSVPLYLCDSGSGDHMISPDPGCEVYDTVELLGYAETWAAP